MNIPKYNISEYIIENKEKFKKYFFKEVPYVENASIFSPQKSMVKKRIDFNTDISKKWEPIINSYLSDIDLSNNMINLISAYLEIISMYENHCYSITNWIPNGTSIKDELRYIANKIVKSPKRSKILGEYYNYNTGNVEYLLEDGTYVQVGKKIKTDTVDLSVFPKEFITLVDESEYRNLKIDEILNG